MTDVLDEVRKQSWRKAQAIAKKVPKRGRGRPGKGEKVNPEKKAASDIRGGRYPLLKNNDGLTEHQRVTLEHIARMDSRLYRAYLLKEDLRAVFSVKDVTIATDLLDSWLSHACRCRIPEVVELSRKVRRHREAILKAVEHGISNARIEATNNKIKLTVRMGYGFRNIDNLIALVMLRCSDLPITLPRRAKAA
jgi:transposase